MTERYYPGKFIREAYQTRKEKGGMEKRVFLKAAAEFLGLSLTASACKPFIRLTETSEPTLTPKPTATPTLEPTPRPTATPTETLLPVIYDPELETFIERPGGINEKVLNLLPNPEYRIQPMLNYLQRVDLQEHKLKFSPIDELGPGVKLSILETGYTAFENINSIINIDYIIGLDTGIKDGSEVLTELITRCNRIYDITEEGSIQRVIGIYEIASQYLNVGEDTDVAVSIVDLVNGSLGDCNDLTAAYFALFNYYHIKTYFVFGQVSGEDIKGKKVAGYHAWVRLEAENLDFDLDPTIYKSFVPLEARNNLLPTLLNGILTGLAEQEKLMSTIMKR